MRRKTLFTHAPSPADALPKGEANTHRRSAPAGDDPALKLLQALGLAANPRIQPADNAAWRQHLRAPLQLTLERHPKSGRCQYTAVARGECEINPGPLSITITIPGCGSCSADLFTINIPRHDLAKLLSL